MFDIGFFELVLIAIVVLVIVGPERMPAFARTAGRALGKFKRALSDVKQEINNEIKADELKEILDRQAKIPGMDEILDIGESTRSGSDQRNAKAIPTNPPTPHQ